MALGTKQLFDAVLPVGGLFLLVHDPPQLDLPLQTDLVWGKSKALEEAWNQ